MLSGISTLSVIVVTIAGLVKHFEGVVLPDHNPETFL